MFKKIIIISMALTFFAATASAGSVVDAPHNDSSGVTCSSCHSYSLWWRYSPVNYSVSSGKGTIVNNVCRKCHDGSKAQIPAQSTHSSAGIASLHGDWTVACVDCHDPHYQGQLDWVESSISTDQNGKNPVTTYTYPAGLYLVKGTIGAVAAGSVANTTSLGYSSVPADILSGWDDRSLWGKKNDNPNLDRGLILVVDTNKNTSTYQVISANNSIITVKGTVAATAAGSSFGLIYGQLIRKDIKTPSSGAKRVTFFDPNTRNGKGGFTDQETPRQGICQVCHTKTSYWTQDASHDGHNATEKCTKCHDAAQGFKFPSHDFLTNTSPCTNCHQHLANSPLAIHANNCQTCHTTPPDLRAGVGLDPSGAALGNGKTATACTYCHSAYFGGHTHSHTTVVTSNTALTPVTANCRGCHSASISPFIGSGEAHAASGCATCHNLTTNGGLKGSAASATSPYGECIKCHIGYFDNHDHGTSGGNKNHAVSLGSDTYSAQSCAACHNSSNGGLATWNDILVEHKNNCGLCHNSGRTVNVRAPYTSVANVISQADAQHPVTCLDCHANHTNDHQTLYVSAYEDGGQLVRTTCTVNCHSSVFSTSTTDPKLHDGCTSCHLSTSSPVTLIGIASGKTVPVPNPFNNCYTCHGAGYSHNNVNGTHGAKVVATNDNTCERCHNAGDTIATIHHNDCALCHDQARGGLLISLASSGPGNCNTCHGSNWLTIHATNSIDHSQRVAMATACSACHASTAGTATGIPVDPLNNTIHGSCNTCHDSKGLLTGIASGHGGAADCQACHGNFGVGVHSAVNHSGRVAMSQACSSCHVGANGTAIGITVGVNPKMHGACASCHGSTGALSGSASGKVGNNSCESCHGLFAAKHGGQDHALTVAMATECSGCHAGAQGTGSGISTSATDHKKHYSCSSCHDTTGALAGIAAGKGGGTDCSSCHGSFASKHGGVSHAVSVSLTTECASCHSGTEGSASGMPTSVSDNTKHDDCRQCHGLDGVLTGAAAGHDATNACADCHSPAVQHTARHFVQINEATDRGLSTNQACNVCHGQDGPDAGTGVLDAWNEVLALHGAGNCAVCHGANREIKDNQGNSQTPVKTIADVILANVNPTNCLACHLDKQQPAEHGFDHIAGGIVSALDRCVSCHTNPNLLTGIHAANGCKTCHDKTTAPVILKGSATGHGKAAVISAGVANTCGTCHTSHAANFLNHAAPDHAARGFVLKTTNSTCDNCHNASDTINGSNMHNGNCANCHTASPGGANDGKLTGSATGKLNGGNCMICHTSTWLAIHQAATPGIGHVTQVGMASECSSCHAGAEGNASGISVDIANPMKHSGCASCHNWNGDLVGLAAGNIGPNTCYDCHGIFSAKHAATDHSSFVSMATDCSGCHTATGNTVDPNNPMVHDSCAQCHGVNGSLVGSALGHTGGGTCNTCHGSFAAKHSSTNHSFRVALAANCADCHTGTQGNSTGIPTSLADNTIHDACSQCHGTTGTLVGSASGKMGATNLSPNDCSTCHGAFINNHATVNHNAMVSMNSNCSGCHTATGNTVIPGDPKAHHACATCHGSNGRLVGSAAGKIGAGIGGHDGGGDCSVCHGSFVANHASVNHTSLVTMATDCSGCHTATGNTVNPNDPKVHKSCASCHNANGSLAGSAAGHVGGGTCNTCHGNFATRHATKNHTTLISLSTDCSGCHAGAEGTPTGMPVGGSPTKHNNCASCHGTTGALISIAIGKGGGAACDSCHGLFAAKHSGKDHSFRVALAANCADCHTGTQGSQTGIPTSSGDNKIHDTCSQCHGVTGTLIGSASGKEGATSTTPNDCSTCHGAFINNHATVNHNAMVSMNNNCTGCHVAIGSSVNPNDPKVHHACASCHGSNGRLVGAAAGKDGATIGGHDGGGDCSLCHGAFVNNHASVDHASRVTMATDCSGCHTATGNTVNPNDPKVHHACATCHNANGSLAGSATGHLGGGSCNTCHGSFATRHATKNHSTLASLSSDCSGCHAGAQGTATGMPVGGSPKEHSSCASCHGATGALVSIAIGKGGGAECNSCHGSFAVKHRTTNHAFRVAQSVNCVDCHAGTEGSVTGIPTSSGDNKIHDTCNQCHGATGTLIGLALGKEGATSTTPNNCSVCHGAFVSNHATVNHNTIVTMNSNCSPCHSAIGNTVTPGDPMTHHACASCHGGNGRLIGVATGKDGGTIGGHDGGGNCSTCHGSFVNNHATVNHDSRVTMASACSGCHTAIGNTVNPADPKVHAACVSCHAANGALAGSATGHTGGGSCTTCHNSFATIHASQDHSGLVDQSTDCSGCHAGAQGLASGMPVGGSARMHSACGSCHGMTGALVSIAVGKGGGAECDTCHGAFAAKHSNTNHSYRVALAPNCADCHTSTAGSASGIPISTINNKVHDSCSQCHGTTGTLIGSASGKGGATSGSPDDCSTCHGAFAGNHATVNHSSMVSMNSNCSGCHAATGNTVIPGDPKAHHACASCHDVKGRLLGAAAGKNGSTLGGSDGGGDCSTCHGSFVNNHASVNHASRVLMATECSGCHTATGNTVNPADPKVHAACASCHSANGALAGSAINHAGGGSCTTCHGSFPAIHVSQDHSGLVGLSSDCSGCHAGAQGTVSGMPVGSAMQHGACVSCHGTTGALVSIAAGKGLGAECDTCHGVFAVKHRTADHSFRAALATNCADCHAGTAGSASGIPISSNDNKVHDACSQCHGATGTLIGLATGKEGATSVSPNDCATCHGAFANNHATVNHDAMVSMTDHCSGCHIATGNTVNPNDPRVHDSCSSCHGANGRLVNQAAGKDGGTIGGTNGGGNCTVCHGEYLPNHQSVSHNYRSIYFGNELTCSACHSSDSSNLGYAGTGTLLTQNDVNMLHNRLTGDSCALCHYYNDATQANPEGLPLSSTVRMAIVNGANGVTDATCVVCHDYNEAASNHSTDHSFRAGLDPNCADCHAGAAGSVTGMPTSTTNNKVHDACNQCHGANGTLIGSASGKGGATSANPNICSTCHGGFASNHGGGTVNHNSMVSMNSNCSRCHYASGNAINPDDPKVHHACASCHGANGRLLGSAAGKDGSTIGGSDGGGDCSTCHGGFANNHENVIHSGRVSMATECSGCHTATGNTVDPADPKVHSACSSCHTDNGALKGSAIGHGGGANCISCHGTFSIIHAGQDHSVLVGQSTDCSGCHVDTQGTVSGMPVGGSAMQHSACMSCHGTTGALVLIAAGNGGGAECDTCHGVASAQHGTTNHAYRVALATNCADCHAGAAGSASGIPTSLTDNKVHDDCSQCHGVSGVLIGSASGKEGATSGSPNDCSTCHGAFVSNHTTVNHSSMVSMNSNCSGCHTATGNTVIPGDPKAHHACTSCHGANGRLIGVAIGKDGGTLGGHDGGGDCSTCHGAFENNHASVNHASRVSMATECSGCHTATGNTVNPSDPKVHHACASCHTSSGTLTGSAKGHTGGGSCTTCHGNFSAIHLSQDHSGLGLSTDCSGCHAGAQGTGSGMPVGGLATKHSACSSCHGTTGVLVSIAAGKGVSAECDTCHGVFATKHRTANHSYRVALATNCADCHTGTAGSGSGIPTSTTDNKVHDACSQCHGATGTLIGSATGKVGATSGSPNDCSTCHGAFAGNHATVSHNSMVSMNGHCSDCHTATGNTVDPNSPRVHHACTSCHGVNGRLVGTAAGKDGGTIGGTNGGGDCVVCHGEYLPNHQSAQHDNRSIYFGTGGLTCSGCHTSDTSVLGSAGTGSLLNQNDVNKLHSRPTGDSCSLCHNYDEATQANPDGLPLWNTVRTAIINGTNAVTDATCVVCHDYNATSSGHFNQPPRFSPTTTLNFPEAILNTAYTGQTIAGTAFDPNNDPITYSKVSGLDWLAVAPDGTLSGTPPTGTTIGNNSFTVRATAKGGTGDATLNITVLAQANRPPAFKLTSFSRADATVSVDYAGQAQTINGAAEDLDGDAITYSKFAGPSWLTVAANGALSGAPLSDTIPAKYSFTVRATDTHGASGDATLEITVVAAPRVDMALLDLWTTPYKSTAPKIVAPAVSGTVNAGTCTVSAGPQPNPQRLLLVAVVMEHPTGGYPTVSATYGGAALTQITVGANNYLENVWIGYLRDADIGTGAVTKTVSVTYSGAVFSNSTLTNMHVKCASFVGVNQTTPVYSSLAYGVASGTSLTFGGSPDYKTLGYVANGVTVVVAGNGSNYNGSLNATPAFAVPTGSGRVWLGQTSVAFYTIKHTGTSTYASTTPVVWTGSAGGSALAAVSLQP